MYVKEELREGVLMVDLQAENGFCYCAGRWKKWLRLGGGPWEKGYQWAGQLADCVRTIGSLTLLGNLLILSKQLMFLYELL